MNRTVIVSFFFLLCGIVGYAQTQQGYVKTRGRMVNGKLVPGTMLSNATVRIKGRNNLVSRSDGSFSFPVTSGKSYMLQGVQKEGYQMVDAEACREYRPSQTPLYIVMETPERQRADLREAQRKIRNNLQRQLQEREAEIERLNIQQVQKDSLIDLLYNQQSDNEKLIADMARRYSEIDYDQLDEFYRQVSYCIEQGMLVKADSLLRLRGDVNQQVEQQLQAGKAIKEEEEKVAHDKAIHSQVNEELARRCYGYYETFAAQHQRDSACHYLELRAKLDTTNNEWQTDAGLYNLHVMAKYDRALEFFQRTLRQSLSVDNGKNMGVAAAYNNIGLVYGSQISESPTALESFLKGMLLVEELIGFENEYTAVCYSNVAVVSSEMDLPDLSMAYNLKAMSIREKLQSDDIDISYNGVGMAYKENENFPLALKYLQKSYEVAKQKRGEKNRYTANYLNNIGGLYDVMMDFPTALDYYHQALAIRQEIFGENHPDIGYSYGNIANTYYHKQDYTQALLFYQKALSVWEQRHDHTLIATSFQNLSIVCEAQGEYENALDYLQKSLALKSEDCNDAIEIYDIMSRVYTSLHDSIHAAECQQKVAEFRSMYPTPNGVSPDLKEVGTETIAEYSQKLNNHMQTLAILERLFGLEHNDVAEVCAAISKDYISLRDVTQAESYLARALSLRRQIHGENSLKVAESYLSNSMITLQKGDYLKAMEYITKAKTIKTELLGSDHPDVATIEICEGIVYIKTRQWPKLIECYNHVLAVKEKTWGVDHIYCTDILEQIAGAYYQLNDYQATLSYFQRALKIKEHTLGPNHSLTLATRSNVEYITEYIKRAQHISDLQVITFTPEGDDSPARQQGLQGEYVVLDYCGWHIGEELVFEDKFKEVNKLPKDIVIIKDGVISKHHFEGRMGARVKTKDILKEEKQRLKESYERWKKKNSSYLDK